MFTDMWANGCGDEAYLRKRNGYEIIRNGDDSDAIQVSANGTPQVYETHWLQRLCCSRRSPPVALTPADLEAVPEEEPEKVLKWKELAEKGELDFYTCLSLHPPHDAAGNHVSPLRTMGGTLVGVLMLQVVVPGLMLSHEVRHMAYYATDDEPEFRAMGFILYLYSLRGMYQNALDECRSSFLQVAFEYNLSWTRIWPALLGEIVNSFASLILSLTLFKVFCGSVRPQDLVINCVAINFIGGVDSEFVTDDMVSTAITNFQEICAHYVKHGPGEDSKCWTCVEKSTQWMLFFVRVGGTLILGHIMAIIFLVSHNKPLCQYVPWLCMDFMR